MYVSGRYGWLNGTDFWCVHVCGRGCVCVFSRTVSQGKSRPHSCCAPHFIVVFDTCKCLLSASTEAQKLKQGRYFTQKREDRSYESTRREREGGREEGSVFSRAFFGRNQEKTTSHLALLLAKCGQICGPHSIPSCSTDTRPFSQRKGPIFLSSSCRSVLLDPFQA